MPTIVPSKLAPSEQVHYSFSSGEGFDLEPGGSYKTDDIVYIDGAAAHPWLEVQYEKSEVVSGLYGETVDPKKDPFVAANSNANDPDAARAANEALQETVLAPPVAIEAGLDQDKKSTPGPVAQTVAEDQKVTPDTDNAKGKS